MSDVKQVKVDNWGIYFLQRLKHFFNRTDYCDLTLQFQDNAQLKVHRLVLNACTEYFELLERTCEMYEDCLVMPEDLQADVVVPIVNFMYTGQLEFKMDALERLYQTSQIMNMPVLSKLLEAHRSKNSSHNFNSNRRYSKIVENPRLSKFSTPTPSGSGKRSYSRAFESNKTTNIKSSEQRRATPTKTTDKSPANKNNEVIIYRDRKLHLPRNNKSVNSGDSSSSYRVPSPIPLDSSLYNKRLVLGEPRPTRYELPEELDTENVFENSFSNISYASQPLMVHPETTKQYSAKKSVNTLNEPTSSKKSFTNTVDIVECKKVSKNDSIFEDDLIQSAPDDELYQSAFLSLKDASPKDPGQLFDQIVDNNEVPKVTIESKDKQTGNLDHAKIISEVLKRYPHLVKSNKNIKLKILNTPAKKKTRIEEIKEKPIEVKSEVSYTYETDVLDSKEAAKLISLGAENIKGPWICLICGTPGRALNFTSYYNYRRHLVDVHKEKPVSTICEHCGLKSHKRNYLLHHIYTKHGVPPPPQYYFPKCPTCDYVALTEGFLVKHKLTHLTPKVYVRCIVCKQGFTSNTQLLIHIQKTGHKQQVDKKASIQCSYCMKVFLRDNNFYCHLKTSHKNQAIRDGLLEDSDDENQVEETSRTDHDMKTNIKYEQVFENELEEEDIQYQLQKRHDGNMHVSKKPLYVSKNVNINQKILNTGFNPPAVRQSQKPKIVSDVNNEFVREIHNSSHSSEGNIVVINDVEYIMKDNQLMPRKSMKETTNEEYILSDFITQEEPDQRLQNLETVAPTTSMNMTNVHSTEIIQQPKMVVKKSTINQPYQIVVSNEEEYKALMASNHSIIFDDGETNKTLTVLTTPQTSTLNTTGINLDSTQSNDMMIIQEDYPLNVTEAVSGDNKYVVVYSHAMDQNDPTKQFQIIAPQEIGAQYVQSSAVLTQNYDTITTSSSVVNANVLGTQIEENWPQSSQHNVVNHGTILVAPETELQSITPSGQTTLKPNEDQNPLIDLPKAEILRIPAKSSMVQLEQVQDVNQTNEVTLEAITNINPEQMVVEENQQNSIEEAMSIVIPAEEDPNKENTIIDENQIMAEHEIEAGCQQDVNMDNIPSQEHEAPDECLAHQDQTAVTPAPPQEVEVTLSANEPISAEEQTEVSLSIEHNESMIEISQSVINENSNTENIDTDETNMEDETNAEEICDSQENVMDEVPANTENVNPPIVQTKEQIQNLTSEWSEDEYDAILEQPETTEINILGNKNVVTDEPEVEESIENIQQEVQKQINEVNNLNVTTDIQKEVPMQELDETHIDDPSSVPPDSVIINPEETQEKISSLLNDWEDNDSQGDDASINENGDEPTAIESNKNDADAIAVTHDNDEATNVETKKDDNIKSLVSDWDDEEEENKES